MEYTNRLQYYCIRLLTQHFPPFIYYFTKPIDVKIRQSSFVVFSNIDAVIPLIQERFRKKG